MLRPISGLTACCIVLAMSLPAAAQICFTGAEIQPADQSSLQATAARLFRQAATGDYAGLRQNSVPAIAAGFSGIMAAMGENKPNLEGGRPSTRAVYLLEVPGDAQRGEFFCGIVNSPESVAFFIPSLLPGRYGIVIQDVKGGKAPLAFTEILQQTGTGWQLAGLYLRPTQIAGHDADWFLAKAREYKTRGQTRNAWFYYVTAWDLAAPVNFMSTPQLDKISDEMLPLRPADLPVGDNAPQGLPAGGKTYKLTQIFPTTVGDNFGLVVKYQVPSLADNRQSFLDNTAVLSALVARAVAPDGQDYGTVLAMKDVK